MLITLLKLVSTSSVEEFDALFTDEERSNMTSNQKYLYDLFKAKSITGNTEMFTTIDYRDAPLEELEAISVNLNVKNQTGFATFNHLSGQVSSHSFYLSLRGTAHYDYIYKSEEKELPIKRIEGSYISILPSKLTKYGIPYNNDYIDLKILGTSIFKETLSDQSVFWIEGISVGIPKFFRLFKAYSYEREYEYSFLRTNFNSILNIDEVATRLAQEITSRYDCAYPPFSTCPKINGKHIVDSYFPYAMSIYMRSRNDDRPYSASFNLDICKLPAYSVAISPFIASCLDVPLISPIELIKLLGDYSKADITTILKEVKSKQRNLTLLGVGGTTINFLYFLEVLCNECKVSKIFDKINIYDEDYLSFHNLLRFPFDTTKTYSGVFDNGSDAINTLDFGFYQKSDSEEYATSPFYYEKRSHRMQKLSVIPQRTLNFLSNDWTAYHQRFFYGDEDNVNLRPQTILYGSPDIETRKFLFNKTINHFFCVTHRDKEITLYRNPSPEDVLLVETYGKIELTSFFLNHLKVTIEFLKALIDLPEVSPLGEKTQEIIYESKGDENV